MKEAAVLMGYGSPDSKDEIYEYLVDVYGGRTPPDYAIRETEEKYSNFSYRSPSTGILNNLKEKIADDLRDQNMDVFLAFKHWKPSLQSIAKELSDKGYETVYALPLFPIENRSVIESYVKPFSSYLQESGFEGNMKFTNGFQDCENLLYHWIEKCKAIGEDEDIVIFTAHSLPHDVRTEIEYYSKFVSLAGIISEKAGIEHWTYAFQSRGSYGKVWLEPSVYKRLDEIDFRNFKRLITVPIGFIYDHLEVLYDLDTVFGGKAREKGILYQRVPLLNDTDSTVKMVKEKIEVMKNE